MSNSIENALKFLNTLEKLSGVSVATDNAVSICKNPNNHANTISNGFQIGAYAFTLYYKKSSGYEYYSYSCSSNGYNN